MTLDDIPIKVENAPEGVEIKAAYKSVERQYEEERTKKPENAELINQCLVDHVNRGKVLYTKFTLMRLLDIDDQKLGLSFLAGERMIIGSWHGVKWPEGSDAKGKWHGQFWSMREMGHEHEHTKKINSFWDELEKVEETLEKPFKPKGKDAA